MPTIFRRDLIALVAAAAFLAGGTTSFAGHDTHAVRLTLTRSAPGEVALTWSSQPSVRYHLQAAGELQSGAWRSLSGLVTATGPATTVIDSNTPPQRFYRVVIVQNVVAVGETNNGAAIVLNPGEILEVTFSENATTGFRWQYSATVSNVVALIGQPVREPGVGIGGSGKVIYQFEPVVAGQTQLRFEYRRSFEPSAPPAQTVELNVTVPAPPAASRWSTRANLLVANSEMGVAELDGKIYVLGGYPASRVTVRTVQVYDTATDTWQLTTPLLTGVNHPMPAVANGKVFVIGGQTDTGSAYINQVQQFDPATTNWIFRAPMPTARSAGAAAVIGDRIYVAGGRPPRGNDFAVYHVTSNLWQTLPNLPTQRNHLAACAIDAKIYVVGGRLDAGFTSPMTNVLEVFDTVTGQWTTRAPMPTTRGGINGIAVHGRFFVFGGEGPNGVFDEMEMYVPAQDRWSALESLPVPVHGVTGAAFVNGWIHLPGGGIATGGSSGSTLHQVFWAEDIGP